MKIVKPHNQIDDSLINLKKYERPKTFHEILKPLLTLAQCFGMLPVKGIHARTPAELKFSFISWRFMLSSICLCGIGVLGSTNYMALMESGIDFYGSVGVLFYSFSLVTMILFMKLAYYWPKLMQEWSTVEKQMYAYPASFNLQKKLYAIAVIILSLAALEHTCSICSTLVNLQDCVSKGGNFQAYFELRFDQVFNRIKFAYWKGIFCQVINIISTFGWTFIDVFIIAISLALTELFQRFTIKIRNVYTQATHEAVWRNIREDFNKVTSLYRLTNEIISDIVLLAFANNLFFICAQILHSINPIKGVVDTIYFFFSMIFLMSRTILLTLMAAKIHEASRSPLPLLFQVPGASYCVEIGRLIQQITAEIIALTGMNFFSVRKEMVLSVAGTIITYELVLIQFNVQNMEDALLKNVTQKVALRPCSTYNDT